MAEAPKKSAKSRKPGPLGLTWLEWGLIGAGGIGIFIYLRSRAAASEAAAATGTTDGGTTPADSTTSGASSTTAPSTLSQWIDDAIGQSTNATYTSSDALNDINDWLSGQCVSTAGFSVIGNLVATLGVPPGYSTTPALTVCTSSTSTTGSSSGTGSTGTTGTTGTGTTGTGSGTTTGTATPTSTNTGGSASTDVAAAGTAAASDLPADLQAALQGAEGYLNDPSLTITPPANADQANDAPVVTTSLSSAEQYLAGNKPGTAAQVLASAGGLNPVDAGSNYSANQAIAVAQGVSQSTLLLNSAMSELGLSGSYQNLTPAQQQQVQMQAAL